MLDMIGLTDTQLKIVMNAARLLPVEKRDTFLQRIAAMLPIRGRVDSPKDVAEVAQLALTGLAHQPGGVGKRRSSGIIRRTR
jgi:hypothetical protein